MSVAALPQNTSAALAVRIFVSFAVAYFLSALLRAVTATLAPVLSAELALSSADLGLLAGAFFLGFAALQLPLGSALDRIGPKRVLLGLTSLAVAGCVAMALAGNLWQLIGARLLVGMGVAAGLMAPLTCYRMRFTPAAQLRANSWMLMTGSLGMLASTLPVQWLLPLWGWRGLFWAAALALLGAMLLVAWRVPADPPPESPAPATGVADIQGYAAILRHPLFLRSMPLGFFIYGGMIAVQTLWAGPWLTRVALWTPAQAAGGLFAINACMLLAFMTWGLLMPRLAARGVTVRSLMLGGLPLSLLVMGWIVLAPTPAGAATWALWCVSTTFASISQPALAQAFATRLAGRALSAFNLMIFAGVFALQWGIGLAIDLLRWLGHSEPAAFRIAFGVYGICALLSYLWYARPLAAPAPAGALPERP